MNEDDKRVIEVLFPALSTGDFKITSPKSNAYNCIAWAVGDTERWWWPDKMNQYFWPENIPRKNTVDTFIVAYKTLGFEACLHGNLEKSFEKIAIYVDSSGKPTHAARQLLNGEWTSKLGNIEDIEHSLEGLEGSAYGKVAAFLKRKY